ncbi:MAG: hypothetical protein JOY90_21755 [Bradyrhizobium sp.]|uniref:hypothetical protein n=1 Tax=Bradyrhizobium sp. TaxID=376 RepID=UPI001D4AA02C|nr:hypothetical protein [Bradyrhizobium sp.]MBV9563043.1 hypothetical protein [Bradyrhizobium sp.]
MSAVLVWSLLNRPPFPEFCKKSEKWFRRNREMFRGQRFDETIPEIVQYFQRLYDGSVGRDTPARWARAEQPNPSCQTVRKVLFVVSHHFAMIVRYTLFHHGMAVMGGDHSVVRNFANSAPSTASTEADRISVASRAATSPSPSAAKLCGAMSQQRGDSGVHSQPQEFVRLIGCRDPKARKSAKR